MLSTLTKQGTVEGTAYYVKAFPNYPETYISSLRKGYWGSEKLNSTARRGITKDLIPLSLTLKVGWPSLSSKLGHF